MKNAHLLELEQGFSLLPVIDELHDEVAAPEGNRDKPLEQFWKLSLELKQLGEQLSMLGPVAYVETDYFGGDGEQAAILWEHGSATYGPEKACIGPINAVLLRMGVRRLDQSDEFDTVGLQRYRSNEDWIEQPKYGRSV